MMDATWLPAAFSAPTNRSTISFGMNSNPSQRVYHWVSSGDGREVADACDIPATMKESKLPAGWDEERVQRVLAYYEEQSEEDAMVEDIVGVEPSETVMNVPQDLVGKVRELIAKRQG
jgi:hypothetical protein